MVDLRDFELELDSRLDDIEDELVLQEAEILLGLESNDVSLHSGQ